MVVKNAPLCLKEFKDRARSENVKDFRMLRLQVGGSSVAMERGWYGLGCVTLVSPKTHRSEHQGR